jgi:hypothetical protein
MRGVTRAAGGVAGVVPRGDNERVLRMLCFSPTKRGPIEMVTRRRAAMICRGWVGGVDWKMPPFAPAGCPSPGSNRTLK